MNEVFTAWTGITGVADYIMLAFVAVIISALFTGLFDHFINQ